MTPGLAVKLRPTGPWRIGPDSGARNRVDVLYHSDSLYSAVTSAMARLGLLEDWLADTARHAVPAVCFSSCFPFLDEITFVVPPRTVWPPTSPAQMSGRVRWKSARFVPMEVVRTILSGRKLNDSQWTVDGPSECLMPAGRPGPFRTGVRWSAAVDRLTGAAERHSTACMEFRAGAGLWLQLGFRDEAARERWAGPVKAAFRLLADTGFGGERSRGWGRSEQPEFSDISPLEIFQGKWPEGENVAQGSPAAAEVRAPEPVVPLAAETPAVPQPEPETAVAAQVQVESAAGETPSEPAQEEPPVEQPPVEEPQPEPPVGEPPAPEEQPETPVEEPEPPVQEPSASAGEPEAGGEPARPVPPAAQVPSAEPVAAKGAYWLLSLYVPASADAVDWARGSYTMLARGGRIDSPAGSGELKKNVNMVAEGSVLVAASGLHGAAADVAPDGFAHPVFRAGFALSVRLPEMS